MADNFTLPPGARIEGRTLIAEIAPGSATNAVHCEAPLDLSCLLGDGLGLVLTVRVRAEGVTKPAHEWNGVKFMLRYEDADTGKTHYPGASLPVGTYGWRTVTNRVNILTAPIHPVDGRAILVLGLQESTGRVEFDLDSLTIATEDAGVSPVNQDYIVRYPDPFDEEHDIQRPTADNRCQSNLLPGPSGLAGSPQPGGRRGAPLKGCMLPHRDPVTEDDIETLHRWGATLVRYQISRNWSAVDDNRDLAEYTAWVDSCLDNIEDVLRWCAARGMKVCVDLHSPPGGKRAGDRAMNMFFEEKFADAFVETWRRIAARCAAVQAACAPAPQSAGVLYGYDLVNEPIQRVPAPFSYWELQRRAAEAIREIDPDTPIVVESNLGCVAESYRYLSPLAMDNVIYQVHLYKPYEYTHQGVWGNPFEMDGRPLVWPDPARGWTQDHLRRVLAPVRAFQEKHRCRIYVGEFSAVSWAPGAENYLRDCIALFAEYGWDWTYHAFREWGAWSVEHEAIEPGRAGPSNFRPVEDSARKRVLIEGIRQQSIAIDGNRETDGNR
ncbi:MAG: cellulase family glycosylhydrolase [Kiritimatiellae bacterium]|nr:cellulase family glycosylhydrolase [Kiritimatiellia bacterium]